MSLVEQDLGTISQVEGTVAKILALFIILGDLILLVSRRSTFSESLGSALSLALRQESSKVGGSVLSPEGNFVLFLVDQATGNASNVVDNGLEFCDKVLVARQDGLDDPKDNLRLTVGSNFRNFSILDITNTNEGVKTLASLFTSLGIGNVIPVLLETRHELGQEGSDDLGVLDKLAHVVDNNSSLTLDDGVTVGKTTLEKRNHDGQSGSLDILNEDGGTEKMDSLGDVLRLSDTVDELGNEPVDIVVGDQRAKPLHSSTGTLLDLRLGIPHSLRDSGDQLRKSQSGLRRSLGNKDVETLEGTHLLGPFQGRDDRLRQDGEDSLDSVGVDGADNRLSSGFSRLLDGGDLVADSKEDEWEQRNNVGLDARGNLLRADSCDGSAGVFSSESILLAVQLLLDEVEDPTGNGQQLQVPQKPAPAQISAWKRGEKTHFVGTSCSSIGPLMKVARFSAA